MIHEAVHVNRWSEFSIIFCFLDLLSPAGEIVTFQHLCTMHNRESQKLQRHQNWLVIVTSSPQVLIIGTNFPLAGPTVKT